MTPLSPPAAPSAACCSAAIGYLTQRLCRYFTMDIMRDPVVAFDGFTCAAPLTPISLCHLFRPRLTMLCCAVCCPCPPTAKPSLSVACSYERCSIEAWFAKGKTTSPKTGAELSSEGHGARGDIACSAA